jgi:hypothetical protein
MRPFTDASIWQITYGFIGDARQRQAFLIARVIMDTRRGRFGVSAASRRLRTVADSIIFPARAKGESYGRALARSGKTRTQLGQVGLE